MVVRIGCFCNSIQWRMAITWLAFTHEYCVSGRCMIFKICNGSLVSRSADADVTMVITQPILIGTIRCQSNKIISLILVTWVTISFNSFQVGQIVPDGHIWESEPPIWDEDSETVSILSGLENDEFLRRSCLSGTEYAYRGPDRATVSISIEKIPKVSLELFWPTLTLLRSLPSVLHMWRSFI